MIFLTKQTLRGETKSVSYHAIYGKIILLLDFQTREVSEQLSLLLWGNRNTIFGPIFSFPQVSKYNWIVWSFFSDTIWIVGPLGKAKGQLISKVNSKLFI